MKFRQGLFEKPYFREGSRTPVPGRGLAAACFWRRGEEWGDPTSLGEGVAGREKLRVAALKETLCHSVVWEETETSGSRYITVSLGCSYDLQSARLFRKGCCGHCTSTAAGALLVSFVEMVVWGRTPRRKMA